MYICNRIINVSFAHIMRRFKNFSHILRSFKNFFDLLRMWQVRYICSRGHVFTNVKINIKILHGFLN